MKTLSYYKQLRESYACIIPKTAPAYELIEALDVLIAILQPDETQPHFLGVPVNLPPGWRIIHHTSGNVCVTLHNDTRQIGHIWTVNDRYRVSHRAATVGDYDSLQSAIKRLINEATK